MSILFFPYTLVPSSWFTGDARVARMLKWWDSIVKGYSRIVQRRDNVPLMARTEEGRRLFLQSHVGGQRRSHKYFKRTKREWFRLEHTHGLWFHPIEEQSDWTNGPDGTSGRQIRRIGLRKIWTSLERSFCGKELSILAMAPPATRG